MAKPRQVKMEQKSALQAMQAMETKSDEELQRETKHKAAALAILGARASERYDVEATREYFRRAVAASRPQERMQLRRMADASIALAERRPDQLKSAVEKLGGTAPSSRQLFLLRIAGLIAPPKSAGRLARVRGILLLLAVVALMLVAGFFLAKLLILPFGGISNGGAVLLGLVLVIIALVVLLRLGRRRQAKALAARTAGGGGPGGGQAKSR